MAHRNLAHVVQNEDGTWRIQSLEEHLQAVARRAGEFADKFGNRDWGGVEVLAKNKIQLIESQIQPFKEKSGGNV